MGRPKAAARPHDLVVVGGGEHACVVIEAARSAPASWKVLGFLDPLGAAAPAAALGVRCLGADAAGAALSRRGAGLILGIGAGAAGRSRREVAARYASYNPCWMAVIHAAAWVSPSARVQPGCFVSAGAVVNARARLEEHAIVNSGAVVEHDVLLGAFSHVAPGAVVGGGASIGEDTFLGLGACIRDHVRLGNAVTVGMGAVVTRDVPDGWTVMGVPARRRRPRR